MAVGMSNSPTFPVLDGSSSSGVVEEERGLDLIIVATVVGGLLVVALLAVVGYRYISSWRCFSYERQKDEEDSTKGTIRISHSLPDLTQDISKEEYIQEVKEKKVRILLFHS